MLNINFDLLLSGLIGVFTINNMLAALLGSFAGSLIGVLPGLGPVAGIAIILPITYGLSPTTGLIMMAAIYYGAMYGGSTTAILLNLPGEEASVVTCIDGFELTKKGRAGAALTIVAVGSFVGGTVSVVGLMLFAPPLANLAILFGPAEFFALLAGGLIVFSRISGGSFSAGVFPMAVGLVLSNIGTEAVTGINRFTFGFDELLLGITLVPVAVGLFGASEIMLMVERFDRQVQPIRVKLREMWPTRSEWNRCWAPFIRGSAIGFVIGLLPGARTVMASFASYRLEKAISKYRHEFGHGAIEGVAGPETANNAAATSTMVPLLALGIPTGAVTALMFSALMVHNVQPGPLLMAQHPEIFFGVIMSMYVGNVILLILNVPLISVWVSLLRVPQNILLPAILLVSFVGSYSVNGSMLDLWLLLVFGAVGYILQKLHFTLAPMVIAIVLGPMIEKHLREGLTMSLGDVTILFNSPIAGTIWGLVLFLVTLNFWNGLVRRLLTFLKSF